jgi:hypothetical protein
MVHRLGAVPAESSLAFLKAAPKGRIAAQQPQVLARLGGKQRSHRLAELDWKSEDKPAWLDEKAYRDRVHPKLANISVSTIAMTLAGTGKIGSDSECWLTRCGTRRTTGNGPVALPKP